MVSPLRLTDRSLAGLKAQALSPARVQHCFLQVAAMFLQVS
jgi:hypothetical protein